MKHFIQSVFKKYFSKRCTLLITDKIYHYVIYDYIISLISKQLTRCAVRYPPLSHPNTTHSKRMYEYINIAYVEY